MTVIQKTDYNKFIYIDGFCIFFLDKPSKGKVVSNKQKLTTNTVNF